MKLWVNIKYNLLCCSFITSEKTFTQINEKDVDFLIFWLFFRHWTELWNILIMTKLTSFKMLFFRIVCAVLWCSVRWKDFLFSIIHCSVCWEQNSSQNRKVWQVPVTGYDLPLKGNHMVYCSLLDWYWTESILLVWWNNRKTPIDLCWRRQIRKPQATSQNNWQTHINILTPTHTLPRRLLPVSVQSSSENV